MPKHNPGTNGEPYRDALAWVHELIPGRVSAEGRTLWEQAHPGQKWDELRKITKRIECIFENVFDSLPTPRRGSPRGDGNKARGIVSNPAERAAATESAVLAILQEKWPAPEFYIEDNREFAGADFLIWKRTESKVLECGALELVARADAKPSPTITSRQLKEARKDNVPYWLVGPHFKTFVSENVQLIPTAYKVYPRQEQVAAC